MIKTKQELLNHFSDINDMYNNSFMYQTLSNMIDELLEQQPKIGKWMSHYTYCQKHELLPSGLVVMWWCDQCEQGVEHPTNFCPNCGCRMIEPQESEDDD